MLSPCSPCAFPFSTFRVKHRRKRLQEPHHSLPAHEESTHWRRVFRFEGRHLLQVSLQKGRRFEFRVAKPVSQFFNTHLRHCPFTKTRKPLSDTRLRPPPILANPLTPFTRPQTIYTAVLRCLQMARRRLHIRVSSLISRRTVAPPHSRSLYPPSLTYDPYCSA